MMNSEINIQAKQELVRAVAGKTRWAGQAGETDDPGSFSGGHRLSPKALDPVAQFHRRAGSAAKESTIPVS